MGQYSRESREEKFAWMRERQRSKAEKAAPQEVPSNTLATRGDTAGDARLTEPPAALPQMLRVGQVAEALGVSTRSVRRWFRKCAVVVRERRNSVMLIPRRALDDWIRERTGLN